MADVVTDNEMSLAELRTHELDKYANGLYGKLSPAEQRAVDLYLGRVPSQYFNDALGAMVEAGLYDGDPTASARARAKSMMTMHGDMAKCVAAFTKRFFDDDKSGVREQIKAHHFAIMNADLRDVASWDRDGLQLVPSDDLTDGAARALRKMHIKHTIRHDENGDTETFDVSLEMEDKHKAALALAGMQGYETTASGSGGSVFVNIVFGSNADLLNPKNIAGEIINDELPTGKQ